MSLDDFKTGGSVDLDSDPENKPQTKGVKCQLIGVYPDISERCKSGRCYYHQVGHHLCIMVQRGIEPVTTKEYYKPGNGPNKKE